MFEISVLISVSRKVHYINFEQSVKLKQLELMT